MDVTSSVAALSLLPPHLRTLLLHSGQLSTCLPRDFFTNPLLACLWYAGWSGMLAQRSPT